MMVELGLRGRVELEKTGMRRKSVLNRKIVYKSDAPTGDVILDEALKHIKETDPPETVQSWIELLSGKSFFKYCQVRKTLSVRSARNSVPIKYLCFTMSADRKEQYDWVFNLSETRASPFRP